MQAEKKERMFGDALVLFFITFIAALLLGLVYEITKEPIAEQQLKRKNEAYKEVFDGLAATREDEALNELVAGSADFITGQGIQKVDIKEALLAIDESGKAAGYVMTVNSKNGYGGNIEIAMGYSFEGKMTGISFLSISETPGLGMNATQDKFKSQFFGVQTESFGLAKARIEGETQVDAISSATITTKAVTLGVNGGISFAADAINRNVGVGVVVPVEELQKGDADNE